MKQIEKEALLIMFGAIWKKKYCSLDGLMGRPSIAECIDFALDNPSSNLAEDLIGYLEDYLNDAAKKYQT